MRKGDDMKRRMMMGLALAAAFGIGGTPASADFVYGIDNAGQILKVDTVTHAETALYTPSPAALTGNGVALDLAGGRLLFRQPSKTGDLYSLNLADNTVSTVQNSSASDLVLTGESSNAAFHDGAYWYIAENTDDLYKVTLTGNVGTAVKFADITGGTKSLGFGDIAFDSDGTMYGSSSKGFFSLNLSSPSSWNLINTSSTLYQIAFLRDGTLIGHSANTGQWYTINKTTGVADLIVGFQTTPLRDIAAAVPEPGSIAMMGLGVGAALAFARRRIKAHA
jgi:hypothetical protein